MSGYVIHGTYASGIVLSPGITGNPVTVASTASIEIPFGRQEDALTATSGSWDVYNYGIIAGPGGPFYGVSGVPHNGGQGISLPDGGTVTNAAPTAVISGTDGVAIAGLSGTVKNSGTIRGFYGVLLSSGGVVVNDPSGTIRGNYGIGVTGGAGIINNEGSIHGIGEPKTFRSAPVNGYGVVLQTGGSIINGSAQFKSAAIYGYTNGVFLTGVGADTVTNFGAITGGVGVQVGAGGGTTDVVSNYGTIESLHGSSGTAVQLGGDNNLLIIHPGAVFVGTVNGGGGTSTLELPAGSGTLSGLGGSFADFGTVFVEGGSDWTFISASTTAQQFVDQGTITIDGTLVFGALSTGSADVRGTIDLARAATAIFTASVLAPEEIILSGGNRLEIEEPTAFGATIVGFGIGDIIELPGFSGRVYYSKGKLVLEEGSSIVGSLILQGKYSKKDFLIDGANGSTFISFKTPSGLATSADFQQFLPGAAVSYPWIARSA